MSVEREESRSLRCHHCGRAVRETTHTREAWRVDYYRLRTGDVEAASMTGDREGELISFLKLIRARELATCADCYRDADVQHRRDELFRPERGTESTE